jgi:LacI family transcriptional regulator
MKRVNIKDIARLAGVGVATVSRVLNDHPDVKDETRENILKVIEDYHYIPNNSARNLKRSNSNDIGMMIKGVYNPIFAVMIQVVEQILSQAGYSVIIHHQMDMRQRDIDVAHEFVQEKKLKGLICLGGDFEDVETKEMNRLAIPVILASSSRHESIDKTCYSSIGIDNIKASYEAVSYLCDVGHCKIGIITSGEGDRSIGGKRTQGYMDALRHYGIPKVEERFEVGGYTFDSAYQAMLRLCEKAPDITAIFAISDVMAIGAAKAIRDMGKRIPEDISIMGFDDIDYAKYFSPALTTMRQPVEEIAEKAADLMLELIELESEHQHYIFQTVLMTRSTVMPYQSETTT